MKLFKNIFLFKVLVVYCFSASASDIYIKIKGKTVISSNVTFIDDVSEGGRWLLSDPFNMLPVSEFYPTVMKSPPKMVKFLANRGNNTSKRGSVSSKVELVGLDIKPFGTGRVKEFVGSPLGNYCHGNVDLSYINLENFSSRDCVATSGLAFDSSDAEKGVEPFKFYRPKIKLDGLVESFFNAAVPAGKYIGTFHYQIGYFSKVFPSNANTYNFYNAEPVNITVDYEPAFLDSVSVSGDGTFNLDYDTQAHTVSGIAKYSLSVNGQISPGIKISLQSTGLQSERSRFVLKNEDVSDIEIPYNIWCSLCERQKLVENGDPYISSSEPTFSTIKFEGEQLDFNLNFSFNDVSYVNDLKRNSGGYYDTVLVRIELDI